MKALRVFVWAFACLFLLVSAPAWTESGRALAQDEAAGDSAGEPETRAERRKRLREERRKARRERRQKRREEAARRKQEREEKTLRAREAAAGGAAEVAPGEGDDAASGEAAAAGAAGVATGDPAAGDPAAAEAAAPAPGAGEGNTLEGMTAPEEKSQDAAGGDAGGQATAKDERPWAQGVSPEDQQAAFALFAEGNKLLKDALFVRAAAKYREALTRWDHPGIHFNLSLALLNLDQPLELHQSLVKALAYGPEALGKVNYERAESMKRAVLTRLAHLEIVCLEPDAKVALDGKHLFLAPGSWQGLVVTGKHNVVATKTGYITANEVRELASEERARLEIKLYTADDVTEYRRRWAVWKPWTVFAGGTAVAVAGSLVHLFSFNNFQEFDRRIDECGGCEAPPDDIALRDRARLQQSIAYSMYAAGGVTLVTGLVLVYANRSRPYRIDVEARDQQDSMVIVPVLGRDSAGVAATFRF